MHQSLCELEYWFPGILDVIMGIWGTNELDDYLNQLIIADRPGREGFPDVVMTELLLLSAVNETLIQKKPSNIWTNRT